MPDARFATMRVVLILTMAALIVACGDDEPRQPQENASERTETPAPEVSAPKVSIEATKLEAPSPRATKTALSPIASTLVRREWGKAENGEKCAPLALGNDDGAGGQARRANFSGGWAVAFDTPAIRSAYGIAGPGLSDSDEAPVSEQRARLAAQWPYFRELEDLPVPSFAGYGVEGAGRYPAVNPGGVGINSLAYVRVAGQTCTYNVWSRLGRAHLERLLDNLVLIAP